uniref:1-acylglycerol-3-phosphate O-acyltransferase n=1 Tax=Papio anubis TaxID=9555 RepID=A0A8I5NPR0_PAPAN
MDLAGLLKSQFLCHLVFCYVFIASGLIINTVQLFTLLLWPINKQLFRKINCRLSYCISSQLVMLLEWWSGTECTIFTDPRAYPKYGKENAIVVLNHKFEIDFLCGWSLSERFGLLGGSKVLAKKELAYVPIIGWMWYFTEMVFCSRKWEQDRKTVATSLQHLRDYPEKYFFLIHCEGTRFTEKKHEISMQVARAKGLPRLKHHLLPRTKGFAITVRSLRNVGKEECVALGLPAAARKTSASSGWAELASCQHFPADARSSEWLLKSGLWDWEPRTNGPCTPGWHLGWACACLSWGARASTALCCANVLGAWMAHWVTWVQACTPKTAQLGLGSFLAHPLASAEL